MKMETQQRSPDESRKHCQVFLRTANQPIYFHFIIEMTVELGCCCFVIHENSKFYECLSDFRTCFGLDVSTRASYGMGSIQQGYLYNLGLDT